MIYNYISITLNPIKFYQKPFPSNPPTLQQNHNPFPLCIPNTQNISLLIAIPPLDFIALNHAYISFPWKLIIIQIQLTNQKMMNNSMCALPLNHSECYRYSYNRVEPPRSNKPFPILYFNKNANEMQRRRAPPSSALHPQIHRFASDKSIEMEGHFNSKHKRNTLPACLQPAISTQYLQAPLTPTLSSPMSRKINFTYRSPGNQQPISLTPVTPPLQVLHPGGQKKDVFSFSKLESRKSRNKLSSCEFSFLHAPKQITKIEIADSFRKYPNKSISSNEELKISNISLERANESSLKAVNQSKMASTVATQSFYNENRRSDFASQDSFKGFQYDSKVSNFGNNSKEDLSARIPMSKQLGDTVIIANNDYTFGGIIDHDFPPRTLTSLFGKAESKRSKLHNQIELRQWNNHVKCLIDPGDDHNLNLKESIHCGPEIRLERHKFELLGEFGRQIKSSTMSIHE